MVRIQENALLSRTSAKLFQEILQSMRSELDEHRSVINENTNECQTNFEFLCQLDKRMDALQDKIGELVLAIKGAQPRNNKVKPLSVREKELFLALLSLTESMPSVTYSQLSRAVGWSTSIVGSYLARMSDKGIPINRNMISGVMHVSIHQSFRQAQIKKNVVGLEVPLSRWMD